jgi:hypothetical protein
MNIKKVNQSVVEETILGLYVWEIDGKWVGDDDGNYLSITSKKGNRERIEMLRKAVSYYGVNKGEPKFLAGRRKIDDEEFQYQQQRLNWGLVPDPLDIGEYKDQIRAAKGAR